MSIDLPDIGQAGPSWAQELNDAALDLQANTYSRLGPLVDVTHPQFTGGGAPTDQSYRDALAWAVSNGYWGVRHPPGVTVAWASANPVEIPVGGRIVGEGYRSLCSSSAPASASNPFAFFQSAGWGTAQQFTDASVHGLRFRRTTAFWPPEQLSPYDSAIRIRNSRRNVILSNLIIEGGGAGIVDEGSERLLVDRVFGFYQGDATIRNVWAGAGGALGATRAREVLIKDCWSISAGTVLDSSTPIGGGWGSAFVMTQPGSQIVGGGCENSISHAVELGDATRGNRIRDFSVLADTSGRNATILVANCEDLEIVDLNVYANNGGLAGVHIEGTIGAAGNTVGQSNIRVLGMRAFNAYTAAGFEARAVRLNGGSTYDITVKDFDLTAMIIHASASGAAALNEVRLHDGMVRRAPRSGIWVEGGVFDVRRLRLMDNGADTSATPSAFRCGLALPLVAAGSAFSDVWSGDTRSGGSRTQQFGYYRESGSGTWERMIASNNVQAPAFNGGAPAFSAPTFVAP